MSNTNPEAARQSLNRYLDWGAVGQSLASFKWYVPHTVTTKPSPSHITAENRHLLITVQTLAVRGILEITQRVLL